MSYQVLARRHRPQTFADVVGQEGVITTLQNALTGDRLPHAMIFTGIRGVGKTSTARILAMAVNCQAGLSATPCGECPSCREVPTGSSIDVIEIDAASNRSVEQVEQLIQDAQYAPARDRRKVYIVDEVHMLSTTAFNALLKTLEEPPAHVLFILATTELQKVPMTILSRCQRFFFRRLDRKTLTTELTRLAERERIPADPEALRVLADLADGSVRDGVSLLDQAAAFCDRQVDVESLRALFGLIDHELVRMFWRAVKDRDPDQLLETIDAVVSQGYDPFQFYQEIVRVLRQLIVLKQSKKPESFLALTEEEGTEYRSWLTAFSEEDLLRMANLLLRGEPGLRSGSQPRFALEALALQLLEIGKLVPVTDLLRRLQDLEQGLAQGRPRAPAAPPAAALLEEATPEPAERKPDLAFTGLTAFSREPTAPPEGDQSLPPTRQAPDPPRQLLERLRQEKKLMLASVLELASGLTLEDGALCVRFSTENGHHREIVSRDDHKQLLVKLAGEITGGPVRLILEEGPAGTRPGTPPPPPRPRGARQEGAGQSEALKNPAVKRVVDRFDGTIIGIKRGSSE